MGKTGITSGGAGDVIFAVPIMKSLGITRLYIKESFYPEGFGSMYSGLKELIEMQGFEVLSTKDDGRGFDMFEPGLKYDYNMDAWRHCRMRGKWHIIFSQMTYWKVMRKDWKRPWLTLGDMPSELILQDYTLWFLSPRWRNNSTYNWKALFQSVPGQKYFIGFRSDYETFCKEVGQIDYKFVPDMLTMARLIRDSRTIYCNQGPWLALAQGIGADYHCHFKPGKTNTMLMTNQEHHLK